jgi:integrase
VKAFMKAKQDEGISVTSSYGRVLPRLQDGALAELPLESIGKEQLADWISTAFAVKGVERAHPETFNTARRRFVTMWKWARDEGYLPKLAKTAPEEIKTRKDLVGAHEPIGIMKLGDWKKSLELIRKDAPELLANLVLGGFCGLRRSELMAQKWADIDVKRGHLRVTKAKPRTPARRLVPLSPAARRWLALCPREGELIGRSWASDHVRGRLKGAEIDCPENAFRHSFISYRCAETGSVDRTAQEAGNSPKIVFQHYRELVTQGDGKAWFAVNPSV